MGFFDEFKTAFKEFEDFKHEIKETATGMLGEIKETVAPVSESLKDAEKEMATSIEQTRTEIKDITARRPLPQTVDTPPKEES
jgi:hypothetical protein